MAWAILVVKQFNSITTTIVTAIITITAVITTVMVIMNIISITRI